MRPKTPGVWADEHNYGADLAAQLSKAFLGNAPPPTVEKEKFNPPTKRRRRIPDSPDDDVISISDGASASGPSKAPKLGAESASAGRYQYLMSLYYSALVPVKVTLFLRYSMRSFPHLLDFQLQKIYL